MKRNVIKGVAIALASLLVLGCMNPFDGGKNTAEAEIDSSGVTIDLAVAFGSEIGASEFLSEEDQNYIEVYVEIERDIDGFLLDEVQLDPPDATYAYWHATVTVQTGMMNFYASAYDIDSGNMLHHGNSQQLVSPTGTPPVTINTSPIDSLAAEISVLGLPEWAWDHESVFIGLVPAEFDFYTHFIQPFIDSGYSQLALQQLAATTFIASGEADFLYDEYLEPIIPSTHLFNWEGNRPWLETEVEYRVFVMIQGWGEMWIPFVSDAPQIGNVTFSSSDHSGAVEVLPSAEFRDLLDVAAAEGGVSYEVTGIDTDAISTDYDDWQLTVAVFPDGVSPFDATGAVVEDIEPVAMGFNWIPAGTNTGGTVILTGMNGYDMGDRWFNIPWEGDAGSYGVYILLGTDWVYGNQTMYLAGTVTGETFAPTRFDFVFDGVVPQLVGPLDIATQTEPITFEYFEMTEYEQYITGEAYWELELEYTDTDVVVTLYEDSYDPGQEQLSFEINEVLTYEDVIPEGIYNFYVDSMTTPPTFGLPQILGNWDDGDVDGYYQTWLNYVAGVGTVDTVLPGLGVDAIGVYDEITDGTIDVTYDAMSSMYTFTWSFTTATLDTLEGSYTGPVAITIDSTTP